MRLWWYAPLDLCRGVVGGAQWQEGGAGVGVEEELEEWACPNLVPTRCSMECPNEMSEGQV